MSTREYPTRGDLWKMAFVIIVAQTGLTVGLMFGLLKLLLP